MRIKFDLKKHKKSNARGQNWKKNKSNSIQLNDWRSLCNFARPTPFLRWRREKREGRRKIIAWVSPCHKDQHASPHHVEVARCFGCHRGRLPMVTRRHHTRRLKGASASHLLTRALHTPTIFFKKIIQRPKHPWSHEIIPRKPKLKNSKCPLILGKKTVDHGSYAIITLYRKYKNPKKLLRH
jgi:hypothetical protein